MSASRRSTRNTPRLKSHDNPEAETGRGAVSVISHQAVHHRSRHSSTTRSARRPRGTQPRSHRHHQPPRRWRIGSTRRRTKQSPSPIFGARASDIWNTWKSVKDAVEVKATNGDTHLWVADDLNQRVIEWIIAEFKKSDGIDLSEDRMALQRLKEAAEKAKMELSTVMETDINLRFITADASGAAPADEAERARESREQLVDNLLQRTVGPTKQALSDAGSTRARSTRSYSSAAQHASEGPANRQGAVRQGPRRRGGQPGRSRRRSARGSRPACWPAKSRTCCST